MELINDFLFIGLCGIGFFMNLIGIVFIKIKKSALLASNDIKEIDNQLCEINKSLGFAYMNCGLIVLGLFFYF